MSLREEETRLFFGKKRVYMKLAVYNLEGKKSGEVDVGQAFSKPVRLDVINRCFLAEQASLRQPYGSDPLAGKRTSAHYHGERGTRYGMMNKEMARLKRIHNQGYMNMTARFSPQAIKGRQAHPPKAWKVWEQKVNKKEKLLGLFSCLAAAADKNFVSGRGHRIAEALTFPIIVEDKLEEISNTKKLKQFMLSLGLKDEMERIKEKKIRAGKGKNRGRRYKRKTGPLVIAKQDKGVSKAVNNLPGFDFSLPNKLSVSLLAPGGHPGRLTILTKSAAEELAKLSE